MDDKTKKTLIAGIIIAAVLVPTIMLSIGSLNSDTNEWKTKITFSDFTDGTNIQTQNQWTSYTSQMQPIPAGSFVVKDTGTMYGKMLAIYGYYGGGVASHFFKYPAKDSTGMSIRFTFYVGHAEDTINGMAVGFDRVRKPGEVFGTTIISSFHNQGKGTYPNIYDYELMANSINGYTSYPLGYVGAAVGSPPVPGVGREIVVVFKVINSTYGIFTYNDFTVKTDFVPPSFGSFNVMGMLMTESLPSNPIGYLRSVETSWISE